MKSFFIDTCSSRIIVAIIVDNKIISIRNEKNGNDLTTRIFPLIDLVIKEANIEPKELDRIYVVNGPGSFTGVRVGVTIAKTMAWALKKDIIPVSELELIATTNVKTDLIVPFIDARRNASFAGIYDNLGNRIIKDTYITNEELKNTISKNKTVTYVSYDIVENFNSINPDIDILKIINRYDEKYSKNPHKINPEYLKLTEAEENLRKNKNA